ncbi:MAG: UDP-N-acetylmuramoyl-tripeptide--D-alanyl-D-alanine ligase [Chlorobium sp.]
MPVKGVLRINDLRGFGEMVLPVNGSPSIEIIEPNVAIDSREIVDGAIFIALKGEKSDGHHYIDAVFEKGANWAMVSREWYAENSPEPPPGRGFIVVPDPVEGLQRLAAMYRNTFTLPVVAIGGSNGKTTTKEMVASVLGTGFRVTMSQGNRNNHLGVPLTLLQLRQESGVAVVEVGINHPGEMALLAKIARPTHALLTNIGHEHLEFLLDLDGVAAAETQLFDYLREHGGTAFVNMDDELLKAAGAGLPEKICYGVSVSSFGSLCRASSISIERDGRLAFLLSTQEGVEKITLNFTGKHNIVNAVAAASVGLHFGLSLNQICEGLEGLVPAPGWKRLEVINRGGLRILNDTYNANSDSMRLAIDALCDIPCEGRRVAVLADMLELGVSGDVEHKTIGRYLHQKKVDMLYTLGESSRLIGQESLNSCWGHFQNHETLLERLLTDLQDGDAVLFKGSRGMRLERVVDALIKEKIIKREE